MLNSVCKEASITELPEKLSFLIQGREVVGMEKTLIIADPEEGWPVFDLSLTHGNFT